MGWFRKLIGSRKDDEQDPILSRCRAITHSVGIELNENEWSSIVKNRNLLASSPLSGAHIHMDVFSVLCCLCVYDGLFERAIELMQNGNHKDALFSLDKAINILPWTSALIASGLAWEMLANGERAKQCFGNAVQSYEIERDIILRIIPENMPSRPDFAANTIERLDKSGALLLGHNTMADAISIARTKANFSV